MSIQPLSSISLKIYLISRYARCHNLSSTNLFSEVRKLASYSKLFEIRHSVLDGLVDIAQKYHPDNLRHVPSVMLLLTHIRQAAERATSYFQSLKKEGSVSFCDLLSEMLDAQSPDSKKQGTSSDGF